MRYEPPKMNDKTLPKMTTLRQKTRITEKTLFVLRGTRRMNCTRWSDGGMKPICVSRHPNGPPFSHDIWSICTWSHILVRTWKKMFFKSNNEILEKNFFSFQTKFLQFSAGYRDAWQSAPTAYTVPIRIVEGVNCSIRFPKIGRINFYGSLVSKRKALSKDITVYVRKWCRFFLFPC
jgi:hypothetical protein